MADLLLDTIASEITRQSVDASYHAPRPTLADPHASARRAVRVACAALPAGDPPDGPELVALYASVYGQIGHLTKPEMLELLTAEERLAHLSLSELKKAHSKAAKSGKLPPLASATDTSGVGVGFVEADPGSRDTSDSGRDTQLAVAGAPPSAPESSLVAHVQRAFRTFERTVGATSKEVARAQVDVMNAEIAAALARMHIEPSPKNFVLGRKAYSLAAVEATTTGTVSDDVVYWYMAVMYAANPTELASFETPTPTDMASVRARIVRDRARPV